MAEILSRDVNGRPLRAGDHVQIISVGDLASGLMGAETTVRGPCPISPPELQAVEIHIAHPLPKLFEWWSAEGQNLKRLDDPDWDEVYETTGYRPKEASCV